MRFRPMKDLQRFASVRAGIHSHFALECLLAGRTGTRSAALAR